LIGETSVPNPPAGLRLQFADDMFLRRHDGDASPAVNQVLWRLDGPYDADRLRDLAERIAAGSLHRRVVRARVPGARHRWAPAGTLPVLDLQTAAVAEDKIGTWAQSEADVPLDPAGGRSWRLAAADVVSGADRAGEVVGGIVSLTCAHAVADGAALIDAVVRASTHADPLVVPAPERGPRALLADAADAAGQAAAVARWAQAKAREAARAARAAESPLAIEPPPRIEPAPRVEPVETPDDAESTEPTPPGEPVETPTPDDAGWRAPVLHVDLPSDQVNRAATEHGGTPNTWFIAFLARLVHATGRFPGEPVPVALPVATRGPDDPRANSTKIARVTIPADVLARRDLGWIRAATKGAYTAVGQTAPGVAPVPLELVQMLPDTVVSRLPQPPVAAALASNLGKPPEGYTQAPGGSVRAVATLSHYQGATAAELRASGGGLVAFCTTVGPTTTLSVAALDPDRVADAETLRGLVLAEAAAWYLPAAPW
jgi:diacylglycerol O-acyltransferase